MSSVRCRLKPEYAVAAVYVAAMFVNILDTTIITVTLPTLAREFDASTDAVEWVVTGYLLSLAVWIPASGWIGDRFGTKRVFLFALTIFSVARAMCGFATSLDQLILFRILQGVGGGMMTPVGFAMLMRAFPPERRAAASKVLIIPTALAPASGPVVGGMLVDWLSWRWVFFVNVPLGIAAFIFGAIFLEEHREPREGGFDLPGFILSAGGMATLLYALSTGPSEGWGNAQVFVPGLVGLVAVALLIVLELRTRYPMLKIRLVGDRLFRSTMIASTFSTGAFLGLLFTMPLFLQNVRGVSALESGLTTFPEAIGVLVGSQISGRFYPTVGPRRLMAGGLTAMACALTTLTMVDVDTSLWVIRAMMFVMGFSMSFVFIPLQAASMARISPADTGHASAIFNTQRQVASAFGIALLATILSVRLPDAAAGEAVTTGAQVSAYHEVFLVGALMAVCGVVAALMIRDSDAHGTMRVAASPERERRASSAAR